jgi:hypothetical protein
MSGVLDVVGRAWSGDSPIVFFHFLFETFVKEQGKEYDVSTTWSVRYRTHMTSLFPP